jgi:hypothetical protein
LTGELVGIDKKIKAANKEPGMVVHAGWERATGAGST